MPPLPPLFIHSLRSVRSVTWAGVPEVGLIGGGMFIMTDDFRFKISFQGGMDVWVTVKNGFKFDGCSIPKFARSMIGGSMDGPYRIPALLHDALYAARIFDRRKCDEIMLCGMVFARESWWKRNVIWLGLEAGGWIGYDAYSDGRIKTNREHYVGIDVVHKV